MPEWQCPDSLQRLRLEVLSSWPHGYRGERAGRYSFGIGWQFYVSRSEKQPDGTWQDVDSKTVSASGLEELVSARNPLHTPDPLPAHVDVTIREELIDDCD